MKFIIWYLVFWGMISIEQYKGDEKPSIGLIMFMLVIFFGFYELFIK